VESPDLTRIVDTYVRVHSLELGPYFDQLRADILPHVRSLQESGAIRWFSFLIHGPQHLDGREPMDGAIYLHLRFEPSADQEVTDFVRSLPSHFVNPVPVALGPIADLDGSQYRADDPSEGWRILGECSDLVLKMVEGYDSGPDLPHVIQYLHYVTNPLLLGQRCLCIPAGFMSF
jgi:hypothetical protein